MMFQFNSAAMSKDLFKWTPMTEDLRPSRKPGKRINKVLQFQ